MRSEPPSRWLIERPVGPFDGLDSEFDDRTAVPHFDVEFREGGAGRVAVLAFASVRTYLFDGEMREFLTPSVLSVMEQSALR